MVTSVKGLCAYLLPLDLPHVYSMGVISCPASHANLDLLRNAGRDLSIAK